MIENKIDYTKNLYENIEIKKKGFELKNINDKISLSILKNLEENKHPEILFCCYGGVVNEVIDAAYNLMIEQEISSSILKTSS